MSATTTTIATATITDALICEPGGHGILLPLLAAEQNWNKVARSFLYLTMLSWCFLGVAIVADIFMSAIEAVTSKRRLVRLPSGTAYTVKVWNATVANLTLMALGSSAPEILLAIIEVVGNNFYSGELGPSTIVGSAAFNLLIIIAVCVVVIPEGDARTIEQPIVLLVTAFFSIFAYVWLVFILAVSSPDMVELWEGIVTFLYFPVLVLLAYWADIGKFSWKGKSSNGLEDPDLIIGKLMEAGHEISADDAKAMARLSASAGPEGVSLATRRRQSTVGTTVQAVIKPLPIKEVNVGFMSTVCLLSDGSSELVLEVEKMGTHADSSRVGIVFATRDGTMASVEGHYSAKRGFLEIPAGITRARIVVHRDIRTTSKMSEWQSRLVDAGSDCYFWVELVQATSLRELKEGQEDDAALSEMVLSKDRPRVEIIESLRRVRAVLKPKGDSGSGIGQLRFEQTEVRHAPSQDDETTLRLKVQRFNGSEGQAVCHYRTEADSARPDRDFDAVSGELVFPPGSLEMTIEVTIMKKKKYRSSDRFFVILSDADGSPPSVVPKASVCSVTVLEGSKADAAAQMMLRTLDNALNIDKLREGNNSWYEQFANALKPAAGDEEETEEATAGQWVLHFTALPWKLLFAFIPPTAYCGGWVCFVSALIAIGGVTAIIGDLAELLGCCVGVPSTITAITIVALGTSLPDTFASKVAAVEDSTADNAIGNVTGSNSVNVFLGLGLPWMMAGIYWQINGATDAWKQTYPAMYEKYPNGGFVVMSGDLAFSVTVFCVVAVTALAVMYYRRRAFKAELGGPMGAKVNTALFFVLLWGLYIGLASWKALAGDDVTVDMYVRAIAVGVAVVVVGMFILSYVIQICMKSRAARAKRDQDLQNTLEGLSTRFSVMSSGPNFVLPARVPMEIQDVIKTLRMNIDSLQLTCNAIESAVVKSGKGAGFGTHLGDGRQGPGQLMERVTVRDLESPDGASKVKKKVSRKSLAKDQQKRIANGIELIATE